MKLRPQGLQSHCSGARSGLPPSYRLCSSSMKKERPCVAVTSRFHVLPVQDCKHETLSGKCPPAMSYLGARLPLFLCATLGFFAKLFRARRSFPLMVRLSKTPSRHIYLPPTTQHEKGPRLLLPFPSVARYGLRLRSTDRRAVKSRLLALEPTLLASTTGDR